MQRLDEIKRMIQRLKPSATWLSDIKQLCRAATHNDGELVRALIEKGIIRNINAVQGYFDISWSSTVLGRCTPLMAAAKNGHLEACRQLIEEHGARVGVLGATRYDTDALHCAIRWGKNPALVEYLVKRYLIELMPNIEKDLDGSGPLILDLTNREADDRRDLTGKEIVKVNDKKIVDTKIDDKKLASICGLLKLSEIPLIKRITKLILANNKFTYVGVQSLRDMLKVNSTIRVLDLSNNKSIAQYSMPYIVEALDVNKGLVMLRLAGCGFIKADIEKLLSSFSAPRKNAYVERIDVDDEIAKQLAESDFIPMINNHFDVDAISASAIRYHGHLTKDKFNKLVAKLTTAGIVDFSHASVEVRKSWLRHDQEPIAVLSEFLALFGQPQRVAEIKLMNSQLTDEVMLGIVKAIQANPGFSVKLDVSRNKKLTNKTAQSFMRLLNDHPNMPVPVFDGCSDIGTFYRNIFDDIRRSRILSDQPVDSDNSDDARVAELKNELGEVRERIARLQVGQSENNKEVMEQQNYLNMLNENLGFISLYMNEKKQRADAEAYFAKNPNLDEYYHRVRSRLENLFTACAVVESGLVTTSRRGGLSYLATLGALADAGSAKCDKELSSVAVAALSETVTTLLHIAIPVLGVVSAVSKGLVAVDVVGQANNVSKCVKQGVQRDYRKAAEWVARKLTLQYEEQLLKVSNNKFDKPNANTMDKFIDKLGELYNSTSAFLLNSEMPTSIQYLADFAVLRMFTFLIESGVASNRDLGLAEKNYTVMAEQLLDAVIGKDVWGSTGESLWTSMQNAMRVNIINTCDGQIWSPANFYFQPGIKVPNNRKGYDLYSVGKIGPHVIDAEKFGYREGTKFDAERFNIQMISVPSASTSPSPSTSPSTSSNAGARQGLTTTASVFSNLSSSAGSPKPTGPTSRNPTVSSNQRASGSFHLTRDHFNKVEQKANEATADVVTLKNIVAEQGQQLAILTQQVAVLTQLVAPDSVPAVPAQPGMGNRH
jgi:hypothetical protein